MKHFTLFALTAMLMGGCDHSHDHAKKDGPPAKDFYGTAFDPAGAISQAEMFAAVTNATDSLPVKFNATIVETCAHAGCWLTVENGNMPMYVFMEDHDKGVPLEGCSKLKCVINGIAFRDTLSVESQKHYLEDAKKPQSEIDAITAPLPTYAVIASGVMIEGYDENHAGHDHENCNHDHSHEGHDHSHEGEEHGH